jgi:hypothetical protein
MTSIKINKLLLISFTLIALIQFSYGQKTEINFNVYSGLFSFHGNGASSTSWINDDPYLTPQKFTSNPYGKKSEFSYSVELQAQRVIKNNNIYGAGISFETLTSKVLIDTATNNGIIYWQYSAEGKTSLKNTYVTLNPFAGHRFTYRKINFDALAGFDIAFCLKSKETGNATASNNAIFTSNNDRTKPLVDLRPRIQIKTQFKKAGLLIGYSLGLTNYQTQNKAKAYSNYLRLGLSYQIK